MVGVESVGKTGSFERERRTNGDGEKIDVELTFSSSILLFFTRAPGLPPTPNS